MRDVLKCCEAGCLSDVSYRASFKQRGETYVEMQNSVSGGSHRINCRARFF